LTAHTIPVAEASSVPSATSPARAARRRSRPVLAALLSALAALLGGLTSGAATAVGDVGDPPLCTFDANPSLNTIGVELPTLSEALYGTTVTIYLMRWNGYRYVYDGVRSSSTWYGSWEGLNGFNNLSVTPWRHGYYRIASRVVGANGATTGTRLLANYRKNGPGWVATGSYCRY
jgi:hypothetical protein